MKSVLRLATTLGNGIINLIKGIVNIFKYIALAIFRFFRFIVIGTYNGFVSLISLFVKTAKAIVFYFRKYFVVPLLPSYKVVFSMYQVIPGLPVNKSDSVHQFEKGHGSQAISFYNNVVKTTAENRIVPAEVYLVKRRRVVAKQQFGPVNEIKKLDLKV
jgi:hypothetical protein